ncbi:MAG TPA: response regulator [Planctomycetota bacterium]|nr:response regulator [Planctomycetota bacterium]
MRILIVDDDADIREIVSVVLAGEGHEVTTAVDGLAALELLRSGLRPSLTLLDLMMPRLDGEEFMKAVRSAPELAPGRVVILSGDTSARRKAVELGVEGCLLKPVELDDLLRVVAEAPAR